MQSRLFQFAITLNEYRAVIITLVVFAVLLAFFVMPSVVVEAGKAASTGG